MITNRETDIIEQIFAGKTNKEIADSLCISQHTVKAHIEHVFRKYSVHSKIELIIKLSKCKIEFNDD